MKLIIQVPCFNEAEQLPLTLPTLPRSVPGFTHVEWLVIDDGSTDGSLERLREILAAAGDSRHPTTLIRLRRNFGQTAALAAGFDHANSFSRTFRRATGMTPLQYRQQKAGKVGKPR